MNPFLRRTILLSLGIAGAIGILYGTLHLRSATRQVENHYRLPKGTSAQSGRDLEFWAQESRRTLSYALSIHSENAQRLFIEESRSADAKVREALRQLHALTVTGTLQKSLDDFERSWQTWDTTRDEIVAMLLAGDDAKATRLDRSQGQADSDRTLPALHAMKSALEQHAGLESTRIQINARDCFLGLGVFLGGAALLVFAVLAKLGSPRTASLPEVPQGTLGSVSAWLSSRRRAAILEMVGSHAPLDRILDALAELASSAAQGVGAALWITDHGELRLHAAAKLPKPLVEYLALLTDPLDTTASAGEFGFTTLDPVALNDASGLGIGALQLFLPDGVESFSGRGFVSQMAELAALAVEHRLLFDRLAFQVQHDNLTELPDRLLFQNRLQQAIRRSRRNRSKLAVVSIDLDRFKQVNERLGHQAGDELLCELARRLQSCLRESDMLARIGGDQFTVLIGRVASAGEAQLAVERMMTSIGRPLPIGAHDISLTATAGISMYPDHGEDPSTLLRNADLAMYSAKHTGRNSCQVFAEQLGCTMRRRLKIEQELCNALDREEFSVEYQPVVRSSGQLHGLEALLRWNSAALGFVSPAEFIPIAEEIGLMTTIGEWITRAACRDGAQWMAAGYSIPRITVNASAAQFRDRQFGSMVEQALEEFGLSPRKLGIEVTESLFINDLVQVTDQIEPLRRLGVTFAIDDFGTGYSCLSRLAALPVDFVKIDQSFIKELRAEENASSKLVRGIVELAHSLDLQVIAEGVETGEQLAHLATLGCDISQGFFLYRPMSPNAVLNMLMKTGAWFLQGGSRPAWVPAPVEIRAS
jgi:diguanylate cyclase (GGDEF)-like protein